MRCSSQKRRKINIANSVYLDFLISFFLSLWLLLLLLFSLLSNWQIFKWYKMCGCACACGSGCDVRCENVSKWYFCVDVIVIRNTSVSLSVYISRVYDVIEYNSRQNIRLKWNECEMWWIFFFYLFIQKWCYSLLLYHHVTVFISVCATQCQQE